MSLLKYFQKSPQKTSTKSEAPKAAPINIDQEISGYVADNNDPGKTETPQPADTLAPTATTSVESSVLTEEELSARIERNRKAALEIRKQKSEERQRNTILNNLIEPSWQEALAPEFKKPYFSALVSFLNARKATTEIFPPFPLLFNALNSCPIEQVSVVILGQDPYHKKGQAMGLSFSVQQNVPVPPSLKNIYKELESDVKFKAPPHGNLQEWANQGVLLLNTVLTVEPGKPNSHQKKGWEEFTDAVISIISKRCPGVVFMLWGAKAKEKSTLIDKSKHKILGAAHPSPYSATQFFGCKHFSKANEWLQSKGRPVIKWQLATNPPAPRLAIASDVPTPNNSNAPIPKLTGTKRPLSPTLNQPASPKRVARETPLPPVSTTTISSINTDSNKSNRFEKIIGKTKVESIVGDIFEQTTDVVVVFTDKEVSVSKELREKGGESIENELSEWKRNNKAPINEHLLALTTSGNLPCKMLFHCYSPSSPDHIRTIIAKCLSEANQICMGSITFPIKFGNVLIEDSATIILDTLSSTIDAEYSVQLIQLIGSTQDEEQFTQKQADASKH